MARPQPAMSGTASCGVSTWSQSPEAMRPKAKPARPAASAAKKAPSTKKARSLDIGSEDIEQIAEPEREARPGRERDRGLLAIAPGEEFEGENAQTTREMRGEQDHENRLGEADQRIFRPAQEAFEPRLALDRARERPEMRRQEESQQNSGDAMDERRPPGRVIARPPIDPVHAKSAAAARHPASVASTMKAAVARSRLRSRQAVASRMTVRSPIPPWSAAAAAKTR